MTKKSVCVGTTIYKYLYIVYITKKYTYVCRKEKSGSFSNGITIHFSMFFLVSTFVNLKCSIYRYIVIYVYD